jgi:hypothetical protein
VVGRLDAGYQQQSGDENAGKLFGIRDAVERNQQKADQPGPRTKREEASSADGPLLL